MNKHKRIIIVASIITILIFYVLSGIALNPLILWTSLPLYISYFLIAHAIKPPSFKKLYASYGFIIVSITLGIIYHLTWFLDWQGTKTSSSTSALIFVIFPVYSVILGFVGYAFGLVIGSWHDNKYH